MHYLYSTVVLCCWISTVWTAVSPCGPRSLWRNAAKGLRQTVPCFCTPRCASSPGDRTHGQPLQARAHGRLSKPIVCTFLPRCKNMLCPWGGMRRSKRSFEVVQAYLHRFLRHYSDLIMATPELREASKALRDEQVSRSAVMSFILRQGHGSIVQVHADVIVVAPLRYTLQSCLYVMERAQYRAGFHALDVASCSFKSVPLHTTNSDVSESIYHRLPHCLFALVHQLTASTLTVMNHPSGAPPAFFNFHPRRRLPQEESSRRIKQLVQHNLCLVAYLSNQQA